MKIVFYPVDCCHFNADTLDERPLGGTETGIIRLSEALYDLGHDVFVLSKIDSLKREKPAYITPSQIERLGSLDAVIVVRGWSGLFSPFNARKRFFWTGDSWDNRHTLGLGDKRVVQRMDAFFPVSDWHAHSLCKASGFPIEKTFVLRNGIKLSYFEGEEVRQKKRLIYSSTPNRGLLHLPLIYVELKARHPDLELHVFSSNVIYSKSWPPLHQDEGPYKIIFDILRKLPDCYLHGSVLQKQLAREYMRSGILAYPSDFLETSCITAMEAQAAGCPIVTTDLAALKETVGEAGFLIQDMPDSETYRHLFVEYCTSILSDSALFDRLSLTGKRQAKSFDWKHRAQELLNYLRDAHGLT